MPVTPATPYAFGQPLTIQEVTAVLAALIAPKPLPRSSAQQQARMFTAICRSIPMRIEHEVNRLRGIAFDSGEAGFSHSDMS